MTALSAKLNMDVSGLKSGAAQAATAVSRVRDELDKAEQSADDLAKTDIEIDTAKAEAKVRELRQLLIATDGIDARAKVRADIGQAEAELRTIKGDVNALDGKSAEVKVKADTSDARRGLDGLTSALDGVGGKAGEVSGILSGLATKGGGFGAVAAGITGAVAGINQLAATQANLALEAQTYADLVGTSVENASRLLVVTKNVGVEANDLSDITLQMTQAFQDSPELAKELGINLGDGKDGAERLLQVLQKMNDPLLSNEAKARIFGRLLGEEGVRQGQTLITKVGDIGKAIEDIPDALVITDEDVEAARRYQATMRELQTVIKSIAADLGNDAIPLIVDYIQDVKVLVNDIRTAADAVSGILPDGLLPDIPDVPLNIADGYNKVRDELGQFGPTIEARIIAPLGVAIAGMDEFGAGGARALERIRAAADAARNSTIGVGGAADTTAIAIGGVTEKLDAGTDSFQEYADAQLAAIDPAFAYIKAQQDLSGALKAVEEGGPPTVDELIRVAEAQGRLTSIAATLASTEGDATQSTYDLGIAAGLSATDALILAGAVSDAEVAAAELEGDYKAEISQTGADEVQTAARNTKRAIEDIPPNRNVTITVTQINRTSQAGSGGGGFPLDNDNRDSGGFIAAGRSALVAERRPEFVNGALVTVPTIVYGPAQVTSGARTQAILQQTQQSGQISSILSARNASTSLTAPGTGTPAPIVQVILDGQQIGGAVARSVQLAEERAMMLA